MKKRTSYLILCILFLGLSIDIITGQSYVTSSPDSVCAGAQNVVYRIPPPADQSSAYNWSITGVGVMTIYSAPVNDSIYVNWPATVGVDYVRVFQSVGVGCEGPEAELEVRRYLPTAVLIGSATACQGSAVNGSFTITFTGKAPFSATYQFTSGGNTIGPVTVNNINSTTYTINIPAVANAGTYTGSIVSAGDANCNIANPTGAPVLNVINQPAMPIIQHID